MDTPTDTPTDAPVDVVTGNLDGPVAAGLPAGDPTDAGAPAVPADVDAPAVPADADAPAAPADADAPAAPAVSDPTPPANLEALLVGAVEDARAAILAGGDGGVGTVGDYLGASFDDPSAATHRFLADMPGYQGWQWAVVVAAHPGAARATISEVVLVPGPTALLAPAWVPWQERVRPGDLGPGDLLATPADDPRLVQGYESTGDEALDELAGEIGLGRRRLLSQWGRMDAAQRWFDGDFGPDTAMARATRRVCRDCGFYLPLTGSLGRAFGVCANEMSADGHVVADEYGCGAHSDTPAPAAIGSPAFDPFDDGVVEVTVTTATIAEVPAAEVAVVEAPVADEVDPAGEAPAVDAPTVDVPEPETEAPEGDWAANLQADGSHTDTPASEARAADGTGPVG